MRVNNEKGMALAITLLIIVVLIALGGVFVLRAFNEKNISDREIDLLQSFYLAEAGSEAALEAMEVLINTDMFSTINSVSPQVIINNAQTYVANGDGLSLIVTSVLKGGVPQFILNGTQAEHTAAASNLGAGNYQFDIIVTENGNPFTSGPDEWRFPYIYRVEATGSSGDTAREVVLTGDFTVQVQRDNFAKYALFTNEQTLPNGTNVWFTDKTNFAGPTHTNGRYNIALNPSGVFEGLVEQAEQTARFYNSGSPVLMDADSNPGIDVPTFNAGFNRGVAPITLSSSVQKQDMIDQSRGGETTSGNGIFVANTAGALTGGVYVNGDSTVSMSVNGSGHAVYDIIQGSNRRIITIDKTLNQTTVDDTIGGVNTYSGLPDGMDNVGNLVYVDGTITSFSGTVQHATEMTLASEGNIIISDHVQYENYTAAVGTPGQPGYVPPHANGEANLLGMVSWNGDVRIGTAAPNNVNVHGTMLAQNGIFQVDNYNDMGVGPRGTATLLGGVISDFYGAFGLFSGSTGNQLSGYGRNFVYDGRMQVGKSPPYFPSLNTFIGFTNDLTDKLIFQEGGA